jgi:hypothetical protein
MPLPNSIFSGFGESRLKGDDKAIIMSKGYKTKQTSKGVMWS